MIYTIYPLKDTTLYQDTNRADYNYGLDEILEIQKFVSHSQVNGIKNSRMVISFHSSSLPSAYRTQISSSHLQLFCATEEEISRHYNLIIGRGQTFINGTGKLLRQPSIGDGATWNYSDAPNTTAWRANWPRPFSSHATESAQYHTASRMPFNVETYTPDIYQECFANWKYGTGSHNGSIDFVIHRVLSEEEDGASYGTLKYFSNESKTIFRPRLHLGIDDYSTTTISTYISSSHMKITTEGQYAFSKDEIQRVYFYGHDTLKDTNSYSTSSKVSTRNYISAAGKATYIIKDSVSDTKYHHEHATYTRVSNDSTGHYMQIDANSFIPGREYTIDILISDRQYTGSKEIFEDVHRFKVKNREIVDYGV
tara:strand:- start:306 stop:1406 length:1101 start_codon:yes stop_codon:yes gene_type:complete